VFIIEETIRAFPVL